MSIPHMSDVEVDPPQPRVPVNLVGFVGAAVGLGSLALAQPILDLLGRNPEFLVAHRLTPLEIVLMAVFLLAVPLVPALMGVAIARWSATIGTIWVGLVIGVITMLLALQIGHRLPLPTWTIVSASAVVGLGAAGLFMRFDQAFGRYLLAAPPVVLAWFLLVLPPSILDSDAGSLGPGLEIGAPVPVVVLVFDEFPVASLMAADGSLLTEQFPSFGRLAADGVWYRNAVTVETRTTEAVPAILSGQVIADGRVPDARSHPHTLFTLLSDSHDVRAVESVTELCPDTVCRDTPQADFWSRWGAMLKDVAIVYGHLVAPWVDRLPPVDQGWAGFGASATDSRRSFDLMEEVGEVVAAGRRVQVARFLATLDIPAHRPALRVAHLLLPHRPWEFLPDGRRHGDDGIPGYSGRGWGPDEYFVATGWRRHLLQVGYVDTVVGEVVARLEAAGVYDSTLLVVVADHGVAFQPGIEDMRVTRPETVGSIVAVPLFVKYPAGLDNAPVPGTIDDTRAETIDIVPTILDVQAAPLPDYLDGVSLLGPGSSTRLASQLEIRGELLEVGAAGQEKLKVAREKAEWFPSGDVWKLVPSPELRPLLGRPLDEFERSDDPGLKIELVVSRPRVEGTVTSASRLTGKEIIALADGNRVLAFTKVFDLAGGTANFAILLDPSIEATDLQGWLLGDLTDLTR